LAEHREGVGAYTGGADKQAAVVTQRPVLAARGGGGAGHVWRVGDRDLGRPLYLQQQPGAAASIENKHFNILTFRLSNNHFFNIKSYYLKKKIFLFFSFKCLAQEMFTGYIMNNKSLRISMNNYYR